MNTDLLEKAFATMITKRSVHVDIGIDSNYVQQLRYKLRRGINIRMDTKLRLLQRGGWRQDDKIYSRKDLVNLLNFWKTTSQAARELGPEYVIDKWKAGRPHP